MWVKLIITTEIQGMKGNYNIQGGKIIKKVILKQFDSYLKLAEYINNRENINFKVLK